MRDFRKVWSALISGLLSAVIGPTVAWAAQTTPSAQTFAGDVVVGAAMIHVDYLTYQHKTYLNEADLIAVLNRFGLDPAMTGDALDAEWLGPYHASSNLRLGHVQLHHVGSFTIRGTVYANLSRLAKFYRWKLQYNKSTGTLYIQTVHQKSLYGGGSSPNTVRMAQKASSSSISHRVYPSWASFQGVQASVVHIGQSRYIGVWYLVHVLGVEGYHAAFTNGRLVIKELPTVVSTGAVATAGSTNLTTLIRYQQDWYLPLSTLTQVFGEAAASGTTGDVVVEPQSPTRVTAGLNPAMQGQFTVSLTMKQVATSAVESGNSTTNATTGTATTESVLQPAVGASNTAFFLLADGSTMSIPLKLGTTNVTLPGNDAVLMGYMSGDNGWIGLGQVMRQGSSTVIVPGLVQQGTFIGQIRAAATSGMDVTVRDEATHQEYTFNVDAQGRYQGALPYGVYDIWAVQSGGTLRYIGSRFVIGKATTRLGRISVPDVSQLRVATSAHSIALAENVNVSGAELENATRIFEAIYQRDVQRFQMKVKVPAIIEVFGSQSEFTQHFLDESYSDSISSSYGADAQAVTEGSRIIALNASNMSLDDEVNVLAHEFTHVILQQNLQNVPLWLNEGLAWTQGLQAEVSDSPSSLLSQALQWNLWASPIKAALSAGQLTSFLTASTVSSAYNVEAEDNFAVENLIHAAGWANTLMFLKDVSTMGERAAFQSVFHESEDAFVSDIEKELQADATVGPVPLIVKVRTTNDFAGELFVSNPAGKTFVYTGALPNQTYQFQFSKTGTVTAPPALVLGGTTASPVDGYWDIGVENGDSQAFFSISNNDGVGHLVTTNLFSGSANVPEVRLETSLPLGLALVGIH